MVYSQRPLACRAYPVIDTGKSAMLDGNCQFCKMFSTTKADKHGLDKEIEALAKIKSGVTAGNDKVWRYATATGKAGIAMLPEGWVAES
jgi:Fe-S-cluster containining protein